MRHYYGTGPYGRTHVVLTSQPLWWMWDDVEQQGYWVNYQGIVTERSTFIYPPSQECVLSKDLTLMEDYAMDVGL